MRKWRSSLSHLKLKSLVKVQCKTKTSIQISNRTPSIKSKMKKWRMKKSWIILILFKSRRNPLRLSRSHRSPSSLLSNRRLITRWITLRTKINSTFLLINLKCQRSLRDIRLKINLTSLHHNSTQRRSKRIPNNLLRRTLFRHQKSRILWKILWQVLPSSSRCWTVLPSSSRWLIILGKPQRPQYRNLSNCHHLLTYLQSSSLLESSLTAKSFFHHHRSPQSLWKICLRAKKHCGNLRKNSSKWNRKWKSSNGWCKRTSWNNKPKSKGRSRRMRREKSGRDLLELKLRGSRRKD